MRKGRIIVQPKDDDLLHTEAAGRLKGLHERKGARVIKTFERIGNLQVLELPEGKDVEQAITEYNESGLVEFAEPDYILRASSVPNDPALSAGQLWDLSNTGQYSGDAGADIDALAGWGDSNSASNIIVAVVDTGIRYTHEDLSANMWRNSGEIPGNGIDDDGDGIVDDVYGMNAITGSGDPNDDNGHGTHVAGIIGAVGNNGKGTVGVAWKVQLMACKFMDEDGQGATSDAISCIDFARGKGAKIINASWGGQGKSQALQRAIQRAQSAGMIFVAAAGNELSNNDLTPTYPANYAIDNVVTVAATTRNDVLDSRYSNYGAKTVDLAAPGTDIYSTWKTSDNAYATLSGTSMATPVVSGVFALVCAKYPDESYLQIIKRVLDGTDKLDSLTGKCVSGGRVNLAKALGVEVPQMTFLTITPSNAVEAQGFEGGTISTTPADYQISNSGTITSSWTATVNQPWLSLSAPSGTVPPGRSNNVSVVINEASATLGPGSYSGTVTFLGSGISGGSEAINVHLVILPLPQLQVVGGLSKSEFKFEFNSQMGYSYVTETSTDLKQWTSVSTNTASVTGPLSIVDSVKPGEPLRFYRSRPISQPSAQSAQ